MQLHLVNRLLLIKPLATWIHRSWQRNHIQIAMLPQCPQQVAVTMVRKSVTGHTQLCLNCVHTVVPKNEEMVPHHWALSADVLLSLVRVVFFELLFLVLFHRSCWKLHFPFVVCAWKLLQLYCSLRVSSDVWCYCDEACDVMLLLCVAFSFKVLSCSDRDKQTESQSSRAVTLKF